MSGFKRYAMIYHQQFGFNVLPIQGKKPMIQWDNWQLIEQTEKDIEEMNWNSTTTGIGGITGINDLRNIDFDKVRDYKAVELIREKLGLPDNYPWIIKSGSGNGYHIWIRVKESKLLKEKLNGEKSVYRLYLKNSGLCDHMELRWNESQTVLPFSMHQSGNKYLFINEEPKERPAEIEIDLLLDCLDELCELESERSKVKSETGDEKRRSVKTVFDVEKLESAIDYLENHLPINCYEDWYRLGFGLASIGEEGRKYFLKMSLSNPNYHDEEFELNKKFDSFLKDYDGKITLGSVYHIAEKYGWEKPFIKFWYVENEKVIISRPNFKRFLEENGFCKMQLEKGYVLLRAEKNIVREVEIFQIKDFVIQYLKMMVDEQFDDVNRAKVIDAIIRGAGQHFVQQFLEFLETREIKFVRDTKDNAFLFFENGFVEITKDDVKVKKYEELNGFIWDKQIIRKRFCSDDREAEFATFINNICKDDVKRILSLRSAMGYLLHNYKDSTNAKAVIFLDEKLSDGAYGRSGKGLVARAIGKLRKAVRYDGRNFNFSKNFGFQSVTLDTAIIEFNDAAKKFNFDKLFSIITDDITVEKKNKDEMIIPFEQSPKIIISTNYSIEGADDSALDRQFVVEFSDHYSIKHKPQNEFGHRFFDEWSNDEWNAFYNFMISCLQLYLNNGFIDYAHINLEKKKLIDSTCEEFSEFFATVEFDTEYLKKDLFAQFVKDYEEFSELRLNKFTHWLKEAAKIKGYSVSERKSGSARFIKINLT